MKAEIYFDGACMPYNPGGVASYGYIIKAFNRPKIAGCGIAAERGTNNIAEYTALIKALERALEVGVTEAVVRGDSQLAINQMNGIYAVKSPNIMPLWRRARGLASKFERIRFEWVPREKNSEADALSTKAYVEHMEQKPKIRAEEIKPSEIRRISREVFKVRRYQVIISSEGKTHTCSCTCPFFLKMQSYRLHKRSGVRIRCKHIFAVERYLEERDGKHSKK